MVSQLITLCAKKQVWVYDEAAKASTLQHEDRDKEVLLVFAMTRKALSRALKRSAKTSVVAVLNHDGASEQYARLEALTRGARLAYRQLTSAGASGSGGDGTLPAPADERFLVNYVTQGRQAAVDPLLMRPSLCRVDDEEASPCDLGRWLGSLGSLAES